MNRPYKVIIMRHHSGIPTVKEEIESSDLTNDRLDHYGIHVSAEIALRALDRRADPFHYVWDDWFDMDGKRRKSVLVRRSACWLVRQDNSL